MLVSRVGRFPYSIIDAVWGKTLRIFFDGYLGTQRVWPSVCPLSNVRLAQLLEACASKTY